MDLFNLFAKLGLDTSDYEKGLSDAKKEASSFSSKIGTTMKNVTKAFTAVTAVATTVATAITAFATKMVDLGGEIDDNAQRLGLSTEEYQLWSFAMTKAGTDVSTLQRGMIQLSTWTEELSSGQADAITTLNKLGIAYEDFIGLDNAGQLAAITNALQGMEDQTEKASLAQELFGNRVGQQLMPLFNEEQGSLEKLNETLREQGVIVSNENVQAAATLGDKIDLLKATLQSFALSLATEVFPEIGDLIDAFQNLVTGAEGADEQISTALSGLLANIFELLPALIDKVSNLILNLIEGIVPLVPNFVDSLLKVVIDIVNKLADPQNNATIISTLIEAIGLIIESVANNLPTLITSVIELTLTTLENLLSFDNFGKIIEAVQTLVTSIFSYVVKILPTLIKRLISSLIAILQTQLDPKNIGKMLALAVNLGASLLEAILQGLGSIASDIINLILELPDKISKIDIATLFEFGITLAKNIIEGFVSGFSDNLDTSILNGIKNIFSEESLKKYRKMAINLGTALVNGIIDGLNKLSQITIPGFSIGKYKLWDDIVLSIFKIPTYSYSKFADGGMLDDLLNFTKGTAYAIAGEGGAEIVAQGSQGTGVANVEQIAEAQYQGLKEYGLKETIIQAASGVVNGIVEGLSMRTTKSDNGASIVVQIGDREFKSYIIKTINDVLNAKGRKSLNAITTY